MKAATKPLREEFKAVWHVTRICGVCRHESELAIDADGDLVLET